MPPKSKRKGGPPVFRGDPLEKVTAARKAASAASRKPTVKGTFAQGTKSATSSNAARKGDGLFSGGGIKRDKKGRFK